MAEFNYTPDELRAMKNEYAKSASQAQFDLWIAECRNRGLVPVKDVVLQVRATKEWNPETRQKEFVKKSVHITTIQALRKLAERTGKYAGQLPSKWVYLDPVSGLPIIESEIPLPDPGNLKSPKTPWAAKVSVLRTGFQQPITVPARFEAYAQYFSNDGQSSLNSTWANRGPEQLEKCAEALALRKAFPEELGGLYLQEELRDEETVSAVAQPESSPTPPLPPNPETVQTTPATEPKKRGPKKKESVPDAGKPWGGVVGQNSVPVNNPPVTGTDNIHGVDIKDSEIEFPGDDKKPESKPAPERLADEKERKGFMDRLIVLKNKGFTGIREYLLKESGETITNNIPFVKMQSLVASLEDAEKAGKLKELLG